MNIVYKISTDKSKLDIRVIHDYLSNRSYWAKGRKIETIQKSINNSLCFGMYDKESKLIGFARVVSDLSVYAYLLDAFILEEYRGRGLGKKLLEYIFTFPELKGVKRWSLATDDAHELYRKYGFRELEKPEKHMEKVNREHC